MEAAKIEDHILDAEVKAQLLTCTKYISLTDQVIGSVRRIASGLRPTMLDDLGLGGAVDWLFDGFSASHAVPVDRRIDVDSVEFNHEGGTAVFRIIQEALTNVARHSSATSVTLEIVREETNCMTRVADNGNRCLGDVRPNANAYGRLGTRERAASLGGFMQIQTAPNIGFALTVATSNCRYQRKRMNGRKIPAGEVGRIGRALSRKAASRVACTIRVEGDSCLESEKTVRRQAMLSSRSSNASPSTGFLKKPSAPLRR